MEDLKSLGELLGGEHDLFLLQQFVTAHDGELPREVAVLSRLIAAHRNKLRAAAMKLGTHLYAKTKEIKYPRLDK
jgi:hypothetical protein